MAAHEAEDGKVQRRHDGRRVEPQQLARALVDIDEEDETREEELTVHVDHLYR